MEGGYTTRSKAKTSGDEKPPEESYYGLPHGSTDGLEYYGLESDETREKRPKGDSKVSGGLFAEDEDVKTKGERATPQGPLHPPGAQKPSAKGPSRQPRFEQEVENEDTKMKMGPEDGAATEEYFAEMKKRQKMQLQMTKRGH